MVYYKLAQKIISLLKNKGDLCQKELSKKLPKINRAILTGYLRSMTDLNKIKCKTHGMTKVYSLKER